MNERSLQREAVSVVVGSVVGALIVTWMQGSRRTDVAGRALDGLDDARSRVRRRAYDPVAAIAGEGPYARTY